jgi:hypothetical protein
MSSWGMLGVYDVVAYNGWHTRARFKEPKNESFVGRGVFRIE